MIHGGILQDLEMSKLPRKCKSKHGYSTNLFINTHSHDWLRQMMLSLVTSWLICAILTATNVLPPTPGSWGYEARTDTQIDSLRDSPWFRIPYPGEQDGYINKCSALVDKDVRRRILLARMIEMCLKMQKQ